MTPAHICVLELQEVVPSKEHVPFSKRKVKGTFSFQLPLLEQTHTFMHTAHLYVLVQTRTHAHTYAHAHMIYVLVCASREIGSKT
jgi:hypothetical protein